VVFSQLKQIIYADEGNGILGPKNGPVTSCESLEVALDGTEQHNSTVVFVKQKCTCKDAPAADAPSNGTPCPTCR